jgi:tetratricopeptide (TPR) repeat protein
MKKLKTIPLIIFCLLIFYPKILAPNAEDLEITIQSVIDNLKKGEIRQAIKNSALLLEKNPKSPEAHAFYGIALINCGEYKKADAELKRALSLDDKSSDAQLGFGRLAFARGDTESAIRHLVKATSSSHLRFMAYDLLAMNLSSVNRHREAKEAMVRAYEKTSDLTEEEKAYIKSRIEIYDGYQELELYQIPDEFQSTTLDFINSEGHILVPIKVNGHDFGNVHLDTGGSGGLTISSQSADNLDLKIIGQVKGMNVAQELEADVAILDEIQIGELVMNNIPVNLYRGTRKFHGGSSGNLGKEVLQRLNMTIDYKNTKLTFFHPKASALQAKKIEKRNSPETIPFHKDKFIIIRASINGQDPEPFILDTGAGITVIHSDYYFESINPPADKGKTAKLDAPKSFTLDSIQIGGKVYKNIMSIAMDLSQIYQYGKVYYPGIIGNPLFQKSRLHFNFTDSTLVIEELQ